MLRRSDTIPDRIPLPPGEYRISIGFAEVHFRKPGKRRFSVLLESETVLDHYEPKIDTEEDFVFEKTISDGHLDITFGHELDNPKIATIAIDRIR